MSLEEYIAKKIKSEPKAESYDIADLQNMLILPLSDNKFFDPSKIIDAQRAGFNLLWQKSVENLMPVLKLSAENENFKDIKLESILFANLYTTAKMLNSIPANNLTQDELFSYGAVAWEEAAEDGIEIGEIDFFSTPALFALASNSIEPNPEISTSRISAINQYLEKRTKTDSLQKMFESKLQQFTEKLNLLVSKSKLADQIMDQCGDNLREHKILSVGIGGGVLFGPEKEVGSLNVVPYSKDRVKQDYLNEIKKPCENAPESLDAEYKQTIKKVADSYFELNEFFLRAAFDKLPTEEWDFINSPEASFQLTEAELPDAEGSLTFSEDTEVPVSWHDKIRQDKLKEGLAGTELFLVQNKGEQRVYALRGNREKSGNYSLHRLDQTAYKKKVRAFLSHSDYATFYSAPKEWGVEDFSIPNNNDRLVGNEPGVELVLDALNKKQCSQLSETLYQVGNTPLSEIQQIWEFIKHQIPFYNCITSLVKKDLEQALPSCSLDTVILLPFSGRLLSLSSRFASSVAQGMVKTAGAHSIKELVRAGARSAILPDANQMLKLGEEAISIFDPGFGLIISLSKGGIEKIISKLSKQPATAKLAEKLSAETAIMAGNPTKYVSPALISLPGTDSILAVKVTGKLANGENVYTYFTTGTGEPWGRKFTFDKDKGINFNFGEEINFSNIDNNIKGFQNWDALNYQTKLKGKLIPHSSGFYTSFDDNGEITGKLYLVRGDAAVPVTELTQNKYFMINEGSNNAIIMKSSETGEFELVESLPKDDKKITKYLDDSWCTPISRFKRQIDEVAPCPDYMQPAGPEGVITKRVTLPINREDREGRDFEYKYYGLENMSEERRNYHMVRANDIVNFLKLFVQLRTKKENVFLNQVCWVDGIIEVNQNMINFQHLPNNVPTNPHGYLSRNEKLALRLIRYPNPPNRDFDDGMISLNGFNPESSFSTLNAKLIQELPLTPSEAKWDTLLNRALEKLPLHNEEVQAMHYNSGISDPYADGVIKVGDIVGNGNYYVSANRELFSNAFEQDERTNARYAIIFIINSYSARPLIYGQSTLSDIKESVFPKYKYFEVKRITHVADISGVVRGNGNPSLLEIPHRIVVELQEVMPTLPLPSEYKNMIKGITSRQNA